MSPTEGQRVETEYLGGKEGTIHKLVSVLTAPVFTVPWAFTTPGPSYFKVFTGHSETVAKCAFDSAVGFASGIPPNSQILMR